MCFFPRKPCLITQGNATDMALIIGFTTLYTKNGGKTEIFPYFIFNIDIDYISHIPFIEGVAPVYDIQA